MRRLLVALGVAALAAACGSFKSQSGGPDDGGGGGTSSGGTSSGGSSSGTGSGSSGASTSSSSGGPGGSSGAASSSSGTGSSSSGASSGGGDSGLPSTGPGPDGALPSGYCCTADTDCRHRHCADLGSGNKMCEDECDGSQSICNGGVATFTCTWDDAGDTGYCMPAAGMQCVPASSFHLGTKPTGACCTATGDATAGEECLGGNCGAVGADSNPYICTNVCTGPSQCPAFYTCENVADYNVCLPQASTYTCSP